MLTDVRFFDLLVVEFVVVCSMLLEQTESLGLHSAKNEWMSTGDVKE